METGETLVLPRATTNRKHQDNNRGHYENPRCHPQLLRRRAHGEQNTEAHPNDERMIVGRGPSRTLVNERWRGESQNEQGDESPT